MAVGMTMNLQSLLTPISTYVCQKRLSVDDADGSCQQDHVLSEHVTGCLDPRPRLVIESRN